MLKPLFVAFASILFCNLPTSHAEVVINVNATDLSAVKVSTTTAFADAIYTASSADGVTLKDFFNGNTTAINQSIGSTISAYDSSDASSEWPLIEFGQDLSRVVSLSTTSRFLMGQSICSPFQIGAH